MRKIFLANDTSGCHWGSMAVMESLRGRLSNLVDYDIADTVVVNGEGTMHKGNQIKSDALMELLKIAQKDNKETYLINSVFEHEPPYYHEVLRNLDFFSVREILSWHKAQKCGGNPVVLLDNCLDSWEGGIQQRDFKGDTVRGSTWWGQVKLDLPDATILEYNFKDLVETLKTAGCYVTGRHHEIYAAGLAGIPFVAINGNSHKIEGLLKTANLPISTFDKDDIHGIERQVDIAKNQKGYFKAFQHFLLQSDFWRGI